MDKKTYAATKEYLIGTQLPEQTSSYRPVSHGQLIDLTLEGIERAGFSLDKEEYRAAKNGNVANGNFAIRNVADQEMQLQISWHNSYDKSLRLEFSIGAKIKICSNGLCRFMGVGSFKRKHVGDIQVFTPKTITEYILGAGEIFAEIQKERDMMKQIEVSRKISAELIGRAFVEKEFINSTQLNIVKREINHPTWDYGAPNSLWQLYQFCTYSLRNDHPEKYMQDHIDAHRFFTEAAGIIQQPSKVITAEDPRQLTIFQDAAYSEE